MRSGGRRKTIAFFIILGVCLVARRRDPERRLAHAQLARRRGLLIAGLIFFPVIIAGLVLFTIFLVREIRRNEQHDSFINAVTHELKTPVASIRLHLQTLQNRPVDEARRQEFYRIMLEDSDRLLHTIDQVLRAGAPGQACAASPMPGRPRADRGASASTGPDPSFTWPRDADLERRACGRRVVQSLATTRTEGGRLEPDRQRRQVFAARTCTIRGRARPGRPRDRDPCACRDQGVGISPAELKRIFKRFYRIPGAIAVPRQGHRPRPVHRPVRRAQARRPRVRRKRGDRARQHLHAAAAGGRRRNWLT